MSNAGKKGPGFVRGASPLLVAALLSVLQNASRQAADAQREEAKDADAEANEPIKSREPLGSPVPPFGNLRHALAGVDTLVSVLGGADKDDDRDVVGWCEFANPNEGEAGHMQFPLNTFWTAALGLRVVEFFRERTQKIKDDHETVVRQAVETAQRIERERYERWTRETTAGVEGQAMQGAFAQAAEYRKVALANAVSLVGLTKALAETAARAPQEGATFDPMSVLTRAYTHFVPKLLETLRAGSPQEQREAEENVIQKVARGERSIFDL